MKPTGPAGLPGATGPIGPEGPQGSAIGEFQNASLAAGADWCAKVMTADSALGDTPTEIWVDQNAVPSACSVPISLHANRVLRFTQGGTYVIDAPITLRANSSILGGARVATIIQNNGNGDAISAFDTGPGGTDTQGGEAKNIVIEDIAIVGPGNSSEGAGVHIDGQSGAARFTLKRVQVTGHTYGFRLANHLLSVIEQCRAESNTSNGFFFETSPNDQESKSGSTTLTLIGNYALNNGGVGFYYQGNIFGVTSVSDAAQNNQSGGILLDNGGDKNNGVYSSSFISTDVESNAQFGVHVYGASNLHFSSINTSSATSTAADNGHGIWIDSSTQVTITDSSANANAGAGIRITNGSHRSSNNISIQGLWSNSNGKRIFADSGASYVELNSEQSGGAQMNFVSDQSIFNLTFSNLASPSSVWGFSTSDHGGFFLSDLGNGSLQFPTPAGANTFATLASVDLSQTWSASPIFGADIFLGRHVANTSNNSDVSGTIAISNAGSGTHTFSHAYNNPPTCVASPSSHPGSATWWVTATSTAVVVNLSAAGTLSFHYICMGNPN